MPFLREKGEERYSPFSLFPFLPFPTTLLPSVSTPLPSFLLFLFHPSPPLSSPSLLTLFLSSFFPSFLHPLLSKFVKATPLPPPFHRFLFITFPLSLCLFIFRFPTPSLLLHSRIRERIFSKHMENGEKLCTGLVWEEMMSIKD